jgi:hypothetical protein
VGPWAGVPAEVEVIEPTGASTYVFTRIAGAPVTAIFTDRRHLAPASVHPAWSRSPTGSICSTRETGQRLETMQ